VPDKKRILCHKRFDFIERLSAKDFSFYAQSYPLFIGETKTLSINLILEITFFFYQIVDNSRWWQLSQPASTNARRWKDCRVFVITRTDYPAY